MFSKLKKAQQMAQLVLFRKKIPLNHKILVGTHHKTGTVWMFYIFRMICWKFKLKFVEVKDETYPQTFDLLFQSHSRFPFDQLDSEYRGIHLIRDPRDIIISGCFYHQKSNEAWLLKPQKRFNGLSFQEKMNSYHSLDDQLLFEMEHTARSTMREIMNWDYQNPRFLDIKYEDLIQDKNLFLFHEIFTFLGFPSESIPDALNIAYNNSLFSGNLGPSLHRRSGKAGQWEQYFKPVHKTRFLELFGDALITLGYEQNHDWAYDDEPYIRLEP